MISLVGRFELNSKQKVEKFCSENNLTIINLDRSLNHYNYKISGELDDINKLYEFLDKLKTEREQKNIFWRFLNP